jgi:hypothetical protein
LLDAVVSDREATNRDAVAMVKDIAIGIGMRCQNAVRSIRVADVKTKVVGTLGIEMIDLIEAFGDLRVTVMALRA